MPMSLLYSPWKGEHMYRFLAVILVVALYLHTSDAYGEGRVALVIGNSNYSLADLPDLENPKNDAQDIAQVLKKLGFYLVGDEAQLDLTRQQMLDRILEFGDQLGPNVIGLFYYAGHGIAVDMINFLIPVDGKVDSKRKVRSRMVSADTITEQFSDTGGGLNIMILDACRNTPQAYRAFRSGDGEGLAEMRALSGMLISYATEPGNFAEDGMGRNSPYAAALMKVIQTTGVGVLDAFNQVSLEVKKATSGRQIPWTTSVALEGDFFFSGPPLIEPKLKINQKTLELAFWQSTQQGDQPEDYRAYLQQFPDGLFSILAKNRLNVEPLPVKRSREIAINNDSETASKLSVVPKEPVDVMRTITNSRIRVKPSKNSTHLFTVPQGEEVSVLNTTEKNGLKWYQVNYRGEEGYIFAGLLSKRGSEIQINEGDLDQTGWIFLGNYNGDKWTSRYTSYQGSDIPATGTMITVIADSLTVRTEPTLVRLLQNDLKALDYLKLGSHARILETRKYPFTVYVWAKVKY